MGGTTQRAGDCMLGASLTFSPTIAPKTTTPTYTLELCRRRRQRRRRGRGRTEGLVETKEFAFGKCCWGGSALGQHRPALYARSNTPLALLTHRHAQLVECVKHVSNSDGLCSHPALGPHAPGNGDGDIVGEVRTKKYKISASPFLASLSSSPPEKLFDKTGCAAPRALTKGSVRHCGKRQLTGSGGLRHVRGSVRFRLASRHSATAPVCSWKDRSSPCHARGPSHSRELTR